MARDNEHWGYRHITGELAGLGITAAPSTVWEILKRHGIEPAPRHSGPSWAQLSRSQAEAILACDFFTVDLLNASKAYIMAAIEHATRRIHILGATEHPTHARVAQQTRNLLMNSIMERWIGGCRRELLDRTPIWNLPHLRRILRDYETHHNTHRPHMTLASAAPDKPLPPETADLDAFRTRKHDRASGTIHEYHRAA